MCYKKLSVFAVGLLLLTISSCTDNPSKISEKPPQLPPANSMQMDFSNFQNNQKSESAATLSTNNFTKAAGAAMLMKGVVELNLAIPRILLKAAQNANSQLNDSGKWEWKFSKNADGNTFSVRLVASRTDNNKVNWDFYVSSSNLGLNDQLFFSGTTSADGSSGIWTYYSLKNANSQEAVSQINWTVNGDNDISLKLEVKSDRNNNQGDYIEYSFDGTLKTATYYDASSDETTKMQINVNTHAGYIITPNYNNGDKACWDKDFQDTTCS